MNTISNYIKVNKKSVARKARTKATPYKKPNPKEVAKTSVDIKQDCKAEDLETLRSFDLAWEFGPCLGISRLERWERAERLGLNPPEDVRNILKNHEGDKEYTQSLWNAYKI